MRPFDFTAPPAFDAPLLPDDWPVFDAIYFCSLSPQSSEDLTPSPSPKSDVLPSVATLASMPIPPSRSSPRNKDPNHIPRPRNAFMLFRSAFAAAQKISAKIEHDNRNITRIIAHCWNRLSDSEKQVWRDKAAAEKAQHAARYPNYRFNPVARTSKPIKRNVRRNGVEDIQRCEKLAELVMAGKCGQELESEISKIDDERRVAQHPAGADLDVLISPIQGWAGLCHVEGTDVAPFRSPLLPPNQVSDGMPQMPMPVEPQPFYPMDPDLRSSFNLPRFQYQQLNVSDNVSFQTTVLPPNNYPTTDIISAEPDQAVLDYRLLSWNQSDSLLYYNC